MMEDQINRNKLTCITFNCEHASDVRLPQLQELFKQCDVLFLQEHALYKSQFGWFDKLSNGIGSAMDENRVLRGRPNGGAAILWNKNVKATFKPIDYESDRVCTVAMHMNDTVLLLICVYIPCDDRRLNQNLVEYI